MINIFNKIATVLGDYFKKTLIGTPFNEGGAEELKALYKSEFDKAKKISDFIGMIIRSALIIYIFFFFLHLANNEASLIKKLIFNIIGLLTIFLYFKMHALMFRIILCYWLLEATDNFSKIVKVLICIISFLVTIISSYSIAYFVRDFAKGVGALP